MYIRILGNIILLDFSIRAMGLIMLVINAAAKKRKKSDGPPAHLSLLHLTVLMFISMQKHGHGVMVMEGQPINQRDACNGLV